MATDLPEDVLSSLADLQQVPNLKQWGFSRKKSCTTRRCVELKFDGKKNVEVLKRVTRISSSTSNFMKMINNSLYIETSLLQNLPQFITDTMPPLILSLLSNTNQITEAAPRYIRLSKPDIDILSSIQMVHYAHDINNNNILSKTWLSNLTGTQFIESVPKAGIQAAAVGLIMGVIDTTVRPVIESKIPWLWPILHSTISGFSSLLSVVVAVKSFMHPETKLIIFVAELLVSFCMKYMGWEFGRSIGSCLMSIFCWIFPSLKDGSKEIHDSPPKAQISVEVHETIPEVPVEDVPNSQPGPFTMEVGLCVACHQNAALCGFIHSVNGTSTTIAHTAYCNACSKQREFTQCPCRETNIECTFALDTKEEDLPGQSQFVVDHCECYYSRVGAVRRADIWVTEDTEVQTASLFRSSAEIKFKYCDTCVDTIRHNNRFVWGKIAFGGDLNEQLLQN